jgi:hypothetical protein
MEKRAALGILHASVEMKQNDKLYFDLVTFLQSDFQTHTGHINNTLTPTPVTNLLFEIHGRIKKKKKKKAGENINEKYQRFFHSSQTSGRVGLLSRVYSYLNNAVHSLPTSAPQQNLFKYDRHTN